MCLGDFADASTGWIVQHGHELFLVVATPFSIHLGPLRSVLGNEGFRTTISPWRGAFLDLFVWARARSRGYNPKLASGL
jgi:hypothetical protein